MAHPLTAVLALKLQDFPNDELAALNNVLQSTGSVPPQNRGYARALELELISEEGVPVETECLRDALASEVNRRVDEGVFQ